MNSTPGKICSLCKETKSLDSFGKNKLQEDGLHYYCKSCVKNIRNAHKESNPEYYKHYRENNKERIRGYHEVYRKKHSVENDPDEISKVDDAKEKKRQQQREKSKDPEYIAARRCYFRNKYQTDMQFKLKKQFESKLNRLFTDNDVTESSKELIGLTIPEFRSYLETKFLPGMSFENYGTEWQFQRVVPFCDFNLTDPEQAKQCNHYTNIRPLLIKMKDVNGAEGE